MLKAKIFTLAALVVVLISNVFVGRAAEPDPRILWVADSALGRVDGFAVHPNGNIFSHRKGIVSEIDGKTGKLIKVLPVNIDAVELSSIDISSDGKFLAVSWNKAVIIDLSNYQQTIIDNAAQVKFIPNQNKIGFTTGVKGQLGGHDSSIVIMNLNTKERKKIKTEETIHNIAFSQDGRFLATSGSRIEGDYYTTLKLWDVTTLTLIKELKKFDNNNFNTFRIEFTNNNKFVAFGTNLGEIIIFDTENLQQFRIYNRNTQENDFGNFCFINDSLITLCAVEPNSFEIRNFIIDELFYKLGNFITMHKIEYIKNYNILPFDNFSTLLALDLNEIITDVAEVGNNSSLDVNYNLGILTIKNIVTNDNTLNVKIYNLDGKLIKEFNNIAIQNDLLSINLKLTRGIYFLNLKSSNKEYSSKFLVTE